MLKRVNEKRIKNFVVSLARYIFLIAFSYILLYPLLFMLSHAFRDPAFYNDPTVEWIPKSFSLQTIKDAIVNMQLPASLWNSVWAEVISAILSIISCGFAAYGMACFNFKGKKVLSVLMILTILIPSSMILIPNYMNYYNMGLLNTPWVMYLPAVTGVGVKAGFYIFIYQQFYKAIPKELMEAAWIDGASAFTTYVRIIVPASGEAVLTVSLLSIIWHWNDFYNAQMYLSSHPTMATKLYSYFQNTTALGTNLQDSAMASCLMFIAPVLIIYLILQRRFITSISSSGIVG